MRRHLTVLAVLATLVLPFAAASPAAAKSAEAHFDAATDFKSYRTYRWQKAEGPGGVNLDGPVRFAANAALAKKGLSKVNVGEPADLELRYNAGGVSQLTAGVGVAADWWGGLVLIPAGEWHTTAGISMILTEVATDKVVWTGWKVVKGTTENAPLVMAKRAPKYTTEILSKYPAK